MPLRPVFAVGAQGEPGIVVAQHTADGFDVDPVLQSEGGESVPQIVETDVGEISVLENFLVDVHDGVRVVHLARDRGGEHIRIFRVLMMFRDQQINGILRDADPAHGGFRLRPGEGQLAVRVFDVLLADGDRAVFDVKVSPEEGSELAFAQTADQFQIEHGEDFTHLGSFEIGVDVLGLKDLHFVFFYEAGKIDLPDGSSMWQQLVARDFRFDPERCFPEKMAHLNLSDPDPRWKILTADDQRREAQKGHQSLLIMQRTIELPTLRWASSFLLLPSAILTNAQQPSPIIPRCPY